MAGEQIFYNLSQIFYQVKPVCTLCGLGSAFSRSRCIGSSTIPTDNHEIELLAHPGSRGFCFPVR